MTRAHVRDSINNTLTGLPISNAVVTVREVGTTTALAATMRSAKSGGTTVPNPITTGLDGRVEFWLDVAQNVDFRVVAAGYADFTISDIPVQYDQADIVNLTGPQTLVGKTLTSPTISSPTFSGQLLLPAGSASAPALAGSGDTNTGPYFPAADTYAIQVGASEAIRMRLGSKFAQVGIGNVGEPGPGGQSNVFHVHFSNSVGSFGDVVGAAVEVTNESSSGGAGSVPDSSAISAYHYVTAATGDLSSRAVEAQVIVGHASANANANSTSQAIEAAIHTLAAGNGTTKTGVIHLGSYDAAGFAGGVAADYAIRIWGARGFLTGIRQEDTAGNLIFGTNGSDGSITVAGHVSMTGTGKRVIIDGNNATIANRTFVQTKNANSPTYLGTVPNGTSLTSGVMVANEQGLTNFSYGLLEVTNAVVKLNTAKAGSGSVVPMELQYDGTKRIELNSTGLGVFAVTPVARAAAMTQTYSTADRTLSAYTSNGQGTTYGGINNAQAGNVYAQVSNLESLRVAYENLRAFTEDVAQFLNAWIDSEQAYGWAQ